MSIPSFYVYHLMTDDFATAFFNSDSLPSNCFTVLKCIDNLKFPIDVQKQLISLFIEQLARIYLIGNLQQTAHHLNGKLSFAWEYCHILQRSWYI